MGLKSRHFIGTLLFAVIAVSVVFATDAEARKKRRGKIAEQEEVDPKVVAREHYTKVPETYYAAPKPSEVDELRAQIARLEAIITKGDAPS